MKQYVGIVYDNLTSTVGCKLVQDCIAMLTTTSLYRVDLVVCCDKDTDKVSYLLSTLGIQVISDMTKPTLCISYQSEEGSELDIPEQCETLVERTLYTKEKAQPLLIDTNEQGHMLKEDNRISFSNLNRIWNHPNGFTPPDAAMIMLWGPVKA